MDLKDWKKIKEDEKTCTLSHPKGHTMMIALKSLPRIQQEQIKRLPLADGGKVDDDGKGISEQGRDIRYGQKLKKRNESEEKQEMAKDMAKEEAKGRAKFEREHVKPKLKGLSQGGKVAHYDEGSPETVDAADAADPSKDISSGDGKTQITINAAPAQASPPPVVQPMAPQPQAQWHAPMAPPQDEAARTPAAESPDKTGLLSPDNTVNVPEAFGKQQQAIQEQAPIDIAKAKAGEANEQGRIGKEAVIGNDIQQNFQELKNHTQEWDDYVKAHPIKANAYLADAGIGAKILNGVGLFLGGFGTPFGGHNYALDFINKQIDANIDAQKKNLENKHSVYSAYHDLYGDSVVATNLAKVSANDMLIHQTNLAAAQQGTAQALQRAKELSAQKALENNQILLNTSGRLGTLRSGGEKGESGGAPEENKKQSLRTSILLPGADQKIKGIQYELEAKGLGADYAPLMQEYNNAKNADAALKTINNSFTDLMNINERGGPALRAATSGKHAVSGVAGAIGSVFGHGPAAGAAVEGAMSGLSNGEMRAYDRARADLMTALSAATKGTNLGSGDLNALVDRYAPIYGDTPKQQAEKLAGLRKAITEHQNRGYLIKHGMSAP